MEKILKSEETDLEEQKPKPQHEPLHPETGSTSFFKSTIASSLQYYKGKQKTKKTESKQAKEQRNMSMVEETMEHSGEKPMAQHELSHSRGFGPNKGFQRSTADWFKEGLKRSKSTSDQKTNIIANWCIYRIPSKLRNVNPAVYTPQLLSIGLFHYGKPELKDMDKHKEIYVDNFYERDWQGMGKLSTTEKACKLRNFIKLFVQVQSIISCYAGTIDLPTVNDDKLEEIILVDACFIIELFLRNCETEYYDKDYILSSPWLRKAVELELILFENQLPYSLLQGLFVYTSPASSSSSYPRKDSGTDALVIENNKAKPVHFLELTCQFFKDYSMGKSADNVTVNPKHFTDLVRHFMCPDENMKEKMKWARDSVNTPTKSRYNIRKLTSAGVNFVPVKDCAGYIVKTGYGSSKSMSTSRFRNMHLELTKFYIKDDTECIIRNVMALEQFVYPKEAYVCNYFLLMDKLVETVEDVDFLVGKNVIVNMLGCNQAAVKLVNNLCDHIMEEISCYTGICKELNDHYENSWNRHVVSLKRVYFKDLWTGSSTILGLVVLAFSIIGSIQSFKK